MDEAFEVTPEQRTAARRVLYTVLKFWIACPTARCRRWKRCAGDVDRCRALFWPVVPGEAQAYWGALIVARSDGATQRQAVRSGEAARLRWRSIQALQRPKEETPAPTPVASPPWPRVRPV